MLKRLRQDRKYNKGLNILKNDFPNKLVVNSMMFLTFASLILLCMYPETSFAVNIEQQLDKVGVVANGKFKTIGLTAATIGGSIWSVVKGNLKLTAIIIAIGISTSLYLEWIAGGMVIS